MKDKCRFCFFENIEYTIEMREGIFRDCCKRCMEVVHKSGNLVAFTKIKNDESL
jgi:hypothetical protein